MPYKVGTIMLYVRDVAKSREFYTNVLNANVLSEFLSERFALLMLAEGPPIALFARAQGLPEGVSAAPGGFELDIETDDIEATHKEWQAKTVAGLTDIFAIPGGRQFYARDPDGHCLAIYQFEPQIQERL